MFVVVGVVSFEVEVLVGDGAGTGVGEVFVLVLDGCVVVDDGISISVDPLQVLSDHKPLKFSLA